MVAERIRIAHSSMQQDDSRTRVTHDVEALFRLAKEQEWDAIGWTETSHDPVADVIPAVVRKAGWSLYDPPSGDNILAVNPKHTVVDLGYIPVLDRQVGLPKGNFSEKGVTYLTFETPAGNRITLHEHHWVTAYGLDNVPGNESRREARHEEQTQAVIKAVTEHAKGRGISFWMGDTNLDENVDKGQDVNAIHHLFTEAGLISFWDALAVPGQRFPATHGRRSTIDIIGYFAGDARVQPISIDVVPLRLNTDHRAVVAEASILEPVCGLPFVCTEPGSHPSGVHATPVS